MKLYLLLALDSVQHFKLEVLHGGIDERVVVVIVGGLFFGTWRGLDDFIHLLLQLVQHLTQELMGILQQDIKDDSACASGVLIN